jgi:asparagine synthase (glutamine-hydrolysing)
MTAGGPDDAGLFYDPRTGLALGHRRLAILDLSPTGHQPMSSSSGRFVMVYNGEVFNYPQLADDLRAVGRSFRGHSDTEVILEAIEEWGLERAVSRFVGMFAMAVWDRRESRLALVRDRLGIKPLYYGWMQHGLLFASELKAFRACPAFEAAIDRRVLTLFFRYNYVPAPYAIYRDVFKVLPGHILFFDASTLKSRYPAAYCFWSAEEMMRRGRDNPFTASEAEALEALEHLLRESVRLRLISDVPLGAFLSGGVDSSTVVALMQQEADRTVRTFSIGFDQPAYNEAPYAAQVAEWLETDHTEMVVTEKEAMAVIPRLPDIYDEPFADSSQIPTYLLSKLTRRHVTVSLSGDGGDELFCGYDRYFWGDTLWRKMGRLPRWARSGLRKFLLAVPPEKWDRGYRWLGKRMPEHLQTVRPGDRIHKLAEALSFNDRSQLYHWLVSHWRDPLLLVRGADEEPTTALDRDAGLFPGEAFLREMQWTDLTNYLPDDILTKVDRASMAVALEARVPLLDHRVVEFAFRLPLRYLRRDGKGKWILRGILKKFVPENLFERPKMGFGIPIGTWLRGPLKDWAADLLSEDRLKREGFLNVSEVQGKWAEHLSGRRNWAYHLWDVLMWEAWLERWG